MSGIGAFSMQGAAQLERSLMLGIARNPLPQDALPPLTQLSLLAAWKRCKRPAPPQFAEAEAVEEDTRSLLSNESRRALMRLFSVRKQSNDDDINRAALRAVRASGMRLHPFDFAKLEDALALHADVIGAAERKWLAAVRPDKELPESVYDSAPVSEETLAEAGKLQKLQFLKALRRRDPDKARDLIAGLFAAEPAAVRGELLEIMPIGLGKADEPFLSGLSADRAPSVRDAASALLARIAGTPAFARRIERLKEQLAVKTEGLILRKKVLAYVKPRASKPHEVLQEQSGLLEGLSLETIALALGESEKTLMEIAARSEKVQHIALLLLVKAVEAGRQDIAAAHSALLDDADGRAGIELLAAAAPKFDLPERNAIARFALKPEQWVNFPPYGFTASLLAYFGGPAPEDIARRFFDMPAWSRADASLHEFALNQFAPLIPPNLSQAFISRFEGIAPRAALYHQFLQTLPPIAE
jgi:hypothetical protein